jgi:hypothetical protein
MRCAGLLLSLVVLDGCIYARGNLEITSTGYKNYPSSLEAEHARRSRRRRNALIAAPLEIVGGLALAALAIYAPSNPADSDSDSPSSAIADAGKELLGRLLLATGGMAIAVSGVGDGVFGALDPLLGSPLVRDGALVPADQIDTVAPSATPWFTIHGTSVIGTDGVGFDMGAGFSHWIGSNVRLRHAASAELTLPFHSADQRLIASAETSIERAFGRERAGLYPRKSIGVYVAGGWAAIEDRPDAPVMRGGVAFSSHGYSYRLGTTYMAGDRRPSVELGMRMEIRTD